jgi:hypothetical protein
MLQEHYSGGCETGCNWPICSWHNGFPGIFSPKDVCVTVVEYITLNQLVSSVHWLQLDPNHRHNQTHMVAIINQGFTVGTRVTSMVTEAGAIHGTLSLA